jgi:hypothetical protein
MMRRSLRFAVLPLLPMLVAGCLDERSAGTSTETENAVAARTFPVDSVLPPNCNSADHPVVATLRLDSSEFDFSTSRADGKDLEVSRTDGRAIPFEIVFWEPSAKQGRLRVRIDPSLRAPGARFQVRAGLPPAARASDAAVWEGIPAELRTLWNSVLVDDFESGNLLRNRLPDSSFWYLGGALMSSGSAEAGSSRTGKCLHVTCATGQCAVDRTILAATLLANTPRSFHSLDSIEFWARGSGRLWITLESLDSIQLGRVSRGRIDSLEPRRAWTSRILGGDWTRWSIRPTDFDSADGIAGNVGWAALRDSINYLTFLVDNGTEIWIDDIRLHGLVPDDLR